MTILIMTGNVSIPVMKGLAGSVSDIRCHVILTALNSPANSSEFQPNIFQLRNVQHILKKCK